ncbi:AAA family ATPase [Nitrospirillum viridazoti]|uniref:ATPase n=1 Tax=Nitrospirillum viridazoti CBAmc TaxID=1441467 RepID=A0A248JP91_9PROT|nr:DUF3696 domain-containing protein [Nitrospirillum amazonense]ASG20527.1 hypothetical protein Y958_06660 [Nitrospirillum amazonense CBAmc]TWB34132.1 putative ATPase [Nitrospirillum amazonense]
MFNRIYIKNFKCFDDIVLPLSPLTLLTGVNAGGKSTTLQAPLLLAQKLRWAHESKRVALNGPLTQLGTVSEIFHGDSRTLDIGVGLDDYSLIWKLGAGHRNSSTALEVLDITPQAKDHNQERLNHFSNKENKIFKNLLNSIKNIIFIGAARGALKSTFPSPEDVDPIHADVGPMGEYAPWWLAQFLDEDVDLERRHPQEEGTTLRRQVGAWAGELFPGAEVNAGFLDQTGLVRLEMRRSTTEPWKRPANIGYGLSYALPIIIAGLLAKPGQVLIVDSPEAHLHPRAQSNIAKFFATIASSGVHVILETHSDHVLNGTRISVKGGERLKSNQVSIHFFTGSKDDFPQIISTEIDEEGGVSNWPSGFFDQSEKDLATLAGLI